MSHIRSGSIHRTNRKPSRYGSFEPRIDPSTSTRTAFANWLTVDNDEEHAATAFGFRRRAKTDDGFEAIKMHRRGGYNNLENAPLSPDDATTNGSAFFNGSGGAGMINFNARMEALDAGDRDTLERLRRHLQFFFLDPKKKFRIRRQFPFKLAFQILKIVFLTVQLILFAELRVSHVDFLDETVTVMRHKFLKEWDDERDAVVYPPESGSYAVFSSDGLIEHFSFMVASYYNIENESFASFSYDTAQSKPVNNNGEILSHEFNHVPHMKLCIDRIADVTIQNDTYIFDISEIKDCFSLDFNATEVKAIQKDPLIIREFLKARNITFKQEDALIISKATINFNLRTIHFSPASTDQKPECYLIAIEIVFDNSRHSGQVFVKLNTVISYVNLCNGRVLEGGVVSNMSLIISALDVFVLVLCVASLILCSRALFKAYLLEREAERYFTRILGIPIEWSDRMQFLNMWYVMIVVNDIFIIFGTVAKVSIEFRDFDSDLFTITSLLLGGGALMVYLGLFRYLGFFNKYNILILTMKKALPNIMRFMVCAIILYCGFLLTGWVIIGPYSIKFRTLSQSSEALFSLLNGDDMFATFYTINDSNTTINIFGKVYIYTFVCLFIYIVLSLFIAIIMDAYEAVKEYCNEGLKVEHSALKEFLASAAPPNFDAAETREQFAAHNLLHLGSSFLARSRQEIHDAAREWVANLRGRSNQTPPVFDNPLHPEHHSNDPTNNVSMSSLPSVSPSV